MKRNNVFLIVTIFLLSFISVAYAAFNSELTITGEGIIQKDTIAPTCGAWYLRDSSLTIQQAYNQNKFINPGTNTTWTNTDKKLFIECSDNMTGDYGCINVTEITDSNNQKRYFKEVKEYTTSIQTDSEVITVTLKDAYLNETTCTLPVGGSNPYIDKEAPSTPTITKTSYNKFTYSSNDNIGIQGYMVTTSSTEPALDDANWSSTPSEYTIDSNTPRTYHVWIKDGVNISHQTISSYLVTKTEGTGTTLTLKYNNNSGATLSTGCVLEGTTVYVEGTLKTGYNTLDLKKNDVAINSATTHTINQATTFTTSATKDAFTITYNLNGGHVGTECAEEHYTCSFSGTKEVCYGADNSYVCKTATDSILCETSSFGSDPINGRVKHCFISASNPLTYNVETDTFTLNNTARIGNTFKGWSGTDLTGDTNTTVTIPKGSTGNRTYTANYSPKNYTVYLNPNGGIYNNTTSNTTITMTYETSNNNDIGVPTRDGYTFKGWYDTASGGTQVYGPTGKNNETLTFWTAAYPNGTWKAAKNYTFYAQWIPNTYTVTADANGGTIASTTGWTGTGNTSTKSVTYDSTYGTLPTPTRTGYTFQGWNGKNLFNQEELLMAISGATFTDNHYVFSSYASHAIYGNNGLPIEVDSSKQYTFSMSGYMESDSFYIGFKYTDDSVNRIVFTSTSEATASVTSDKPVARTYTSFGWSGIAHISYIQLEEGDTVTPFEPYYLLETTPVTQAKDHTLTAIWKPNTYEITLNNNNATTAGTTMFYYKYSTYKTIDGHDTYYYEDSALTTPLNDGQYYTDGDNGIFITIPERTGYRFGGYYTGTNGTGSKIISENGFITRWLYANVSSNTTLYAYWIPITYTVAYNSNGGTGTMPAQIITYGNSTSLTTNTFIKTGYDFTGWSTSSTDTNILVDNPEHSVDNTSGTTYSDFWISTIKPPFAAGEVYQLEYDAKGSGELNTYFYGAAGYLQVASWTQNDGISIRTGTNTDGCNGETLTTDYRHYTVRFTLSSTGDGTKNKYLLFRALKGATAYIKNIKFYKVSSSSIAYVDEQTVKNLSSTNGTIINLYAIWKPSTYTVTANANGGSIPSTSGWTGTGNTSTKSVTYDSEYGTLPTPTRAGYTFDGWSLLPEGYTQVDYIHFSGTEYIDTGISPSTYNGNYAIELEEAHTSTSGMYIISSSFDNNTEGSRANIRINNTDCDGYANNEANTAALGLTVSGKLLLGDKNYIKYSVDSTNSRRELNVNGNISTSTTAFVSQSTRTFKIDGHGSYGGNIYYLKVYGNNSLVRYMIPCINNSTGKAGLYDLVSGAFFGNQGSGNLTYGTKTYITNLTNVTIPNNHNIYANWTANTYRVTYQGNGATQLSNSNLVAKYDALYHDGNTLLDMSGNERDGTATNVTFGTDYMSFNSSWVNLGIIDTPYQTLEATFTPDTLGGCIIGNWESGGGGLYISDGKLVGEMFVGGYKQVTSTTSLVVGQKYHAALTFDGSNLKLYLNGVLEATTAASGTIGIPTSNTVMSLGSNPSGSTAGGNYFSGKIYNAAIYDTALTAEQISADAGKNVTYDSTYGTLPTPTRTGYTFEGWNGKNLFDETKYSNLSNYETIGSNLYKSAKIQLKPNTTYKISIIRKNGFDGTGRGYLLFSDHQEINNNWSGITHNTYPNYSGSNYVYTTGEDGLLYIGYMSVTQSDLDYIWENTDIQIEEGTIATAYEPYYVTSSTNVTQPSDHTLTAIWTPNAYIVTAMANGGTIPSTTGWTGTGANATKSVTYDNAYGTLPTPTRTGYSFQGWNGKNMLDLTGWLNSFDSATRGTVTKGDNYVKVTATSTDAYTNSYGTNSNYKIPVKPNTTYTLSWQSGNKIASGMVYIFVNNSTASGYMSYAYQQNTNKITITTPSDASYVTFRVGVAGTGNSIVYSNIQFEEGSEATPYVPYLITDSTLVKTPQNHTLTAIWTANTYIATFLSDNLVKGQTLFTNAATVIKNSDTSYAIGATHLYGGAGVPGEIFTIGKTYILKYDIQKESGTLTNIGGHSNAASNPEFYIDGSPSSGSYASPGTNMSGKDDTNVHHVWFKFTYTGNSSNNDNNIYIQPNRGLTTAVGVNITNLAIYEVVESRTVTYNSTYGTMPSVSRTGYTFNNWYKEETYTNVVNSSTTVTSTSNHYIYSKFTANTYTVVYNANDGVGSMSSQLMTYDNPTALTTNGFSKSGYTFAGWNTKADGTGTNYTNGQSVSNLVSTNNGSITLYAKWTLNTYSISYNLNGGSVGTANPTNYNVTSNTITLNNPTRTGYTFTGWTEQTSNIKWNPGFIANSGGAIGPNDSYPNSYYSDLIYLKSGVTYTITNGPSDIRWRIYNTSGTYTGNGSTTASYTATANCYVRILYHVNPTTAQMNNTVVTGNLGTTATIPQGSTGNKTFTANWVDDIAPVVVTTTPSTTWDISNYADFNATDAGSGIVGYNITTSTTAPTTWIPVVNTVETATETKYQYDAAWARVFHHNNHWGLVYFSSDNDWEEAKSSNTSDKYSVLGNIANYKNSSNWEFMLQYPDLSSTAYNRWTQTSNPVTTYDSITGYSGVHIDWSSNYWGGLALTSSGVALLDGSPGTSSWFYGIGAGEKFYNGVPSYSPATSNVNLWARIDNLTTTTSSNLTRRIGDIKENGTYYVWVKDAAGNTGRKAVTISKVDGVSQTLIISSTNNVATSQTATLSMSDNVGVIRYYFGTTNPTQHTTITWTDIASTTSKSLNTTISSSGTYFLATQDAAGNRAVTLKAFYKTTFNANSGSVSPASVITMDGNSFALPTPTRPGYTFGGWYTDSGLTTAVTLTSGNYKPTASATLYAKWTPTPYTITYVLNNGSISGQLSTYTIETNTFTLPTPTKTDWLFTGWSGTGLTGNNNMTVTITKGSTGNRTYTAHFDTPAPKSYSYTGDAQPYTILKSGIYKLELWGAQGGGQGTNPGGKGAYTSGNIYLEEGETIYFYVGNYGYQPANLTNPFNGGGAPDTTGSWSGSHSGNYSGGGASDVRYFTSTPSSSDLAWDSTKGLNSRIMVAAGGGGGNNGDGVTGGVGGTLTGGTCTPPNSSVSVTAPTQTTGFSFGIGQSSGVYPSNGGADTGAGGGGYYGGYRGLSTNSGGSGGSSYISGYEGCVAISSESSRTAKCSSSSPSIDCSFHFTNQIFDNPVMIAGDSSMPSTSGSTETGHAGNGNAKIQYISSAYVLTYDNNGGTGCTKKGASENTSWGTLCVPTRAGYTFAGWNTSSNGNGTNITSSSTASSNLKVYAKWTANSYTVTADANGGNIQSTTGWTGTGNTSTKTVTYTGTYGTLPTASKNGYSFAGWNGKNLLNMNEWMNSSGFTIARGTMTIGNNSITLNSTGTDCYTMPYYGANAFKIAVKPSTTYTLSWTVDDPSVTLRIFVFDFDGTNATTNAYIQQSNTTSMSFTTPSNAQYITFRLGLIHENKTATFTNLQLEEGLTATAYEPYYIKSSTTVTQPSNHTLTAKWIDPSTLSAGLYDSNYNIVKTWAELEALGLTASTIEADYTSSNYKTADGAPYKVLSDNGLRGNLILPNTVTKIGYYAFYKCTMLTTIYLQDSVTTLSGYAFSGCSNATLINIPSSVTSISGFAFQNCSKLTSITIPNSVTSIGNSAFSGCTGITTLNIPANVTSFGTSVFSGCSSLVSITVDANNPAYDSRNNCNAIINSSTNELIAGCRNSTIPNTVVSIGTSAFFGQSDLKSITIPSSVTTIGTYAFRYCGFTSITIPNTVTRIDSGAFQNCTGLTSITIPNNVTRLDTHVFAGCTNLTSVTLGTGISTLNGNTFQNTKITSITIPSNVRQISSYAFEGCNNLTNVTFENPNNWFIATSSIATSGTNITLTDPAQNATYLKDTYKTYYWKRSQ